MADQSKQIDYDAAKHTLYCQGDWSIRHLPALKKSLDDINTKEALLIDGSKIDHLDSTGAWLLVNLQQRLKKQGGNAKFTHFKDNITGLLKLVEEKYGAAKEAEPPEVESALTRLGHNTILGLREFKQYLNFIGFLSIEMLRIGLNPWHWRMNAIAMTIFRNGLLALPIIAVLSFMIGVVLTYQMGLQLQTYGANVFIVDLLGLSILREFSPLITAIMVAGRTGSAYTAELGIMKINQELDALNTMGVTPAELLLLPRIIGLVIALPLLTMWSDIFGLFGGMVMANNMLGITTIDFLSRFPSVVPLKTLLLGLCKTPIFALLVGTVGCFEGINVEDNAGSVGEKTTRSVVLSIFLIILADALFSILFSKMKL